MTYLSKLNIIVPCHDIMYRLCYDIMCCIANAAIGVTNIYIYIYIYMYIYTHIHTYIHT